MLVHHSRNSVQKQWEETLVLALSGMGRILRAHLPVLVTIAGFSQVTLSVLTTWHFPSSCLAYKQSSQLCHPWQCQIHRRERPPQSYQRKAWRSTPGLPAQAQQGRGHAGACRAGRS